MNMNVRIFIEIKSVDQELYSTHIVQKSIKPKVTLMMMLFFAIYTRMYFCRSFIATLMGFFLVYML